MVHGDQDEIVPISQSHAMHTKLQEQGVESTLIVVAGAKHGRPINLFTSQEEKSRVINFFNKHLK